MTAPSRGVLLTALITLLAATAGGWAGVHYGLRQAQSSDQLDEVLHRRLSLSADQQRQLTVLEASFASQRTVFDAQMRLANRDLAAAITVRHSYDAPAREAIDRLHRAMMGLQEATVQHVLAMRALLTPEQMQQFDQAVNQALTVDQP